jgi:5-methylcytosine-specific restriction endonuclease McrA
MNEEYWGKRREIQNRTRVTVWRRDHGKCVVCGRKATCVHEIVPKSALPGDGNLELLFAPKNRCCLCRKHHQDATHTRWARRTLLGLMKMLYDYDYSEQPFRRYF